MKIGFVRVFANDFDRARAFYLGKLGLELDHEDPRFGWAQFHAGEDVSLAIERTDPAGEEGKLVGRYVGVTLVVDDLQATYERLTKAGVKFTAPPERRPWGGTLAELEDTDGNVLTLMQST